jgi:hypothetical protein
MKAMVLGSALHVTATLLLAPVAPNPHVLGPTLFFRLQGQGRQHHGMIRVEWVSSNADPMLVRVAGFML